MRSVIPALLAFASSTLRTRTSMQMEILALRHQLGVYRRSMKRPRIRPTDRILRRMSSANPLWGSPRVVGELRKVGIDVAKSTVEKYMIRTRGAPSSTWKAFLKIHIRDIVAIDFFVVPPVRNQILYALLVLAQ
jgi:hypothetical protein